MVNIRRGRKKPLINIIDKETLVSVSEKPPPLLSGNNLVEVGQATEDQLGVLVSSAAYSTIDTHTQSDLSKEVGGFLVGRPYKWEGRDYVEIVEALPGELTSSSAVHLTISPDTWAKAQETVRKQYSDMHIVGWYHTHPNMFVFMSSQDLQVHQGFFREAWHVALVVEPYRRDAGFFVWQDELVKESEGYHVAYPEDTPEDTRWKPPLRREALIPSHVQAMLDDFCQPGFWHTLWADTDELVVRVKTQVMQQLEDEIRQLPKSMMGLCMGHVRRNSDSAGPRYFVDVVDVWVESGQTDNQIPDHITTRSTKAVKPFDEPVSENEPPHLVGWFCLHTLSDQEFKELHDIMSKRPEMPDERWTVSLIGSPTKGIQHCRWKGPRRSSISRQLVELKALEELTGDHMTDIVNTAMDKFSNLFDAAANKPK